MFLTLAFPVLIVGLAMSAVRQAFALGFVCFAFNAFVDKKLIHYILYILVASTFHKSAFAFVVMAPFLLGRSFQTKLFFGSLIALPVALLLTTGEAASGYTSMYVSSGIDAAGGLFRVFTTSITGVIFVVWLTRRWLKAYPNDYTLVLFFAPAMILCCLWCFSLPLWRIVSTIT